DKLSAGWLAFAFQLLQNPSKKICVALFCSGNFRQDITEKMQRTAESPLLPPTIWRIQGRVAEAFALELLIPSAQCGPYPFPLLRKGGNSGPARSGLRGGSAYLAELWLDSPLPSWGDHGLELAIRNSHIRDYASATRRSHVYTYRSLSEEFADLTSCIACDT